jgi:hypothetical protein
MVGDIILGRTVHTIMAQLNDYAAPFPRVADELSKADLTIADLECSLSDTIPPPDDPYTFAFMTYTAGAQGLCLAGIDSVSQANNHSMNFAAGDCATPSPRSIRLEFVISASVRRSIRLGNRRSLTSVGRASRSLATKASPAIPMARPRLSRHLATGGRSGS